MSNKMAEMMPMMHMMQKGEFCWNELMTPDVMKAKKFYSSLFNWESHDMDMGDATYTMFRQGGKDIGGMMKTPHGKEHQIPPHWMCYINVDCLETTMEMAKKLGATVKAPITNVGDIGRFAVIEDPTGANVAFWQSMRNM